MDIRYFCLDEVQLALGRMRAGACIFLCEAWPEVAIQRIARALMKIGHVEFYFYGKGAFCWENTFDIIAGCEFESDDSDYVAMTLALDDNLEAAAEDVADMLNDDMVYVFYAKCYERESKQLVAKLLRFREAMFRA